MHEICICDYCEVEFKAKRIKEIPYKNLCPKCKKTILGKKCLWCNDLIESKDKEEPWNYYCGYCETVKLGEPDPAWLPSIKKDDIDKKGFHKL